MCPSTGSGPWGGFHPSETPPVLVPRGQGCRQPQGVVSLWDPPGALGCVLCQALTAGSGETVLGQGILSLPGHPTSVPCFLHGKVKTSLLILSTGRRLEVSG